MEKVAANLSRQAMIDEISRADAFFTGIAFLLWIRFANINCHGFGALDMEYTPGWSIGWFFVPIANLFVPYFVMGEIWKVSSDPVGWPRAKGSAVLGWWWVLSWISGFGSFIDLSFSSTGDLVTVLQGATFFDVALDALRIPALLMGIALISEISEKQDQLVRMGCPAPFGSRLSSSPHRDSRAT